MFSLQSSHSLQCLDRTHADLEDIAQDARLGAGEGQAREVGPHITMPDVWRRVAALAAL